MNRRSFFGVTFGAIAAAVMPWKRAQPDWKTLPGTPVALDGPLTFRGIPLVFDERCPKDTIAFVNPDRLWVKRGEKWEQPFAKRLCLRSG